jgi:hypothetical protein
VIFKYCDIIDIVILQNAANCLVSLVFLNESSFVDLVEKLITTRSHAIECIIKNENYDSVKNKLKLCMKVLIQTVHLIYSCFISKYFIYSTKIEIKIM